MFVIIGFAIVIVSVLTGYLGTGGHLDVLLQPFEVLIIAGAAVGAFVIGNPRHVIFGVFRSFSTLLRGSRHNKSSYLELFSLLYAIFKLAKTKGDLALESHVENPEESPLFQKFPRFTADQHSRDFLCDYLRLLTLGTNNAHELESVIDEEIAAHHHEKGAIAGAVTTMADGMPALGIVACVLGVIHTMGAITEPPEVLGHLIGGALVGTFMGILLAYGFVGPVGQALASIFETETKHLQCMKAALLAHMQGYAPQVSVEFARKTLPSIVRPSFFEVEETITNVPQE